MPKIVDKKDLNKRLVNINEKHLQQNAVFTGSRDILVSSLQNYFLEENIEIDLFLVDRFELSVDDVRDMRTWATESSEKQKVIILSSFYWNASAQNALLKILEDTPLNTKIYLISRTVNLFLPTILSRIYFYDYKSESSDMSFAKELLTLDIHLRMQNNNLKKLLAMKVENVDLLKNTNSNINESNGEDNLEDEENEGGDSEVEESGAELTSSKGRKDKEKHVGLFENLFSIIKDEFRKQDGENKINLEYIKNLNKLNQDIYQYGSSPHLSIEYMLLTAPKM